MWERKETETKTELTDNEKVGRLEAFIKLYHKFEDEDFQMQIYF